VAPERPPGSLPVELLLFSYPLGYPPEDGTALGTEAGE
jgi:hypothetical protein